MAGYTREEIELLAAYEAEQGAIRQQLASGIYDNAVGMLARWKSFQESFQPGGRFESLAAQYAAEQALGITSEEIATLSSALTTIVDTMQAIEARVPGMFGIDVPAGADMPV